MLTVHAENIGEMAVIDCEGRIVQNEGALRLRAAVESHGSSKIIVLDLSEVPSIGAAGVDMFALLQRWADGHGIRLKLFNPRHAVRDSLDRAGFMREFDIASLDEMMALLARAESRYKRAA